MPRIALLLEYFGKNFHGSQYQANARTVQAELESALAKLLRQPTQVIFSGRTDSGVHAIGQVAHFDCNLDNLDLWRFNWGLNGILAKDVAVSKVQIVPDDFHARYTAIERHYVYRILNRPQRSALWRDTCHFLPHQLDLTTMVQAARFLLGSHDFRSFKSANADTGTTRCRITRAELLNLGEGQLEFWIAANHFVYNMVRIIVGSLIEIGLGERSPNSLKEALTGCDRNLAGPTAPAEGLTLAKVIYPEHFKLFENL